MVEYSCGDVTSQRQFYFINPQTYTPYCELTVEVKDPAVTQIRLDFEKFSLAQPDGGTIPFTTAFSCNKDRFTISTQASGNLGFQNLCGENAGQHIYVPVDATRGTASIPLTFQLSGGMASQWQIVVTQIDCTSSDTSALCAPPGCLQYYPSQSGNFESFNFNNGAGRYQGLLNYAICFKRDIGECGIQYTANSFTLATDNMLNPYGDSGCDVEDTSAEPSSRDYVIIPEGKTVNNIQASKYCGEELSESNPVTTTQPGPFYMTFRTDDKRDPVVTGEEKGFRFTYQKKTFGC
ncbi:uncharacterized protein [Hetaerina americana]|uniref:uncharacterized protein n=1 Tax=Hetaerina americana TaxID=62018 RepID=UPI003A7F4978